MCLRDGGHGMLQAFRLVVPLSSEAITSHTHTAAPCTSGNFFWDATDRDMASSQSVFDYLRPTPTCKERHVITAVAQAREAYGKFISTSCGQCQLYMGSRFL